VIKGPFGTLAVYAEPITAASPAEVKGYFVVWKEEKRNRKTKQMEHTITFVTPDGVEINTGLVFPVRDYWRALGVDYDHPALRTLREPGVHEYSAAK